MPDEPSDLREIRLSHRAQRKGARRVGAADPAERMTISVRVRRRPGAPPMQDPSVLAETPLAQRSYPSRDAFAETYGASKDDLDKVAAYAESKGLAVVEESLARRTVVLRGTVAQANAAFGLDLGVYQAGQETYRGREGAVHVPAELCDIVEGVFGLDNRKMAAPLLKVSQAAAAAAPAPGPGVTRPVAANEAAALYRFPGEDAKGQTIAIIEFGGGFWPADAAKVCARLGLPAPTVTAVSVDHQPNAPKEGDDYTIETALDVQVAAAAAPGANIVVYFAPWSEQGWVDALSTAVHDNVHKPTVISISYGWPEFETANGLTWSPAAIQAVHSTFVEAANLGITVLVSAGDHGSDCGLNDGKAHVLYPASDPLVIACGGTRLSNIDGLSFDEGVWNDGDDFWITGGGISDYFRPPQAPLPPWQAGATVVSAGDGQRGRWRCRR